MFPLLPLCGRVGEVGLILRGCHPGNRRFEPGTRLVRDSVAKPGKAPVLQTEIVSSNLTGVSSCVPLYLKVHGLPVVNLWYRSQGEYTSPSQALIRQPSADHSVHNGAHLRERVQLADTLAPGKLVQVTL